MKRILASGLILAVLTGTALAQAAAPPPPPPNGGPAAGHAPPPPPPPMGQRADDEDTPPPPPPPRGPRRPPPPSKAAHFVLEQGDIALDVKCADDEPMHACADITLQLLDKLQNHHP